MEKHYDTKIHVEDGTFPFNRMLNFHMLITYTLIVAVVKHFELLPMETFENFIVSTYVLDIMNILMKMNNFISISCNTNLHLLPQPE